MRIVAPLLLLAALVACGTQVTWVTPKGQVFQSPTCDSAEPTPGGGPDTCYYRRIRATDGAEAQCKADGGFIRYSALQSWHMDRLNYVGCEFPYADLGKACTKATDCRGACDAETRTCRQSSLGGPLLDEDGHQSDGAVE